MNKDLINNAIAIFCIGFLVVLYADAFGIVDVFDIPNHHAQTR